MPAGKLTMVPPPPLELPKTNVEVEQFSELDHYRTLVKHYEASIESAHAILRVVMDARKEESTRLKNHIKWLHSQLGIHKASRPTAESSSESEDDGSYCTAGEAPQEPE